MKKNTLRMTVAVIAIVANSAQAQMPKNIGAGLEAVGDAISLTEKGIGLVGKADVKLGIGIKTWSWQNMELYRTSFTFMSKRMRYSPPDMTYWYSSLRISDTGTTGDTNQFGLGSVATWNYYCDKSVDTNLYVFIAFQRHTTRQWVASYAPSGFWPPRPPFNAKACFEEGTLQGGCDAGDQVLIVVTQPVIAPGTAVLGGAQMEITGWIPIIYATGSRVTSETMAPKEATKAE